MAAWVVITAAVAGLASRVDWDELTRTIATAHWGWLVLAAAAMVASMVFRGQRLALLLEMPRQSTKVIHINIIGYLVNTLLPLRAGELSMVYLLKPIAGRRGSGLLPVIFFDRLLDLATVLLLFFAAAAHIGTLPEIATRTAQAFALAVGLTACGVLVLTLFRAPLLRRLAGLLNRLPGHHGATWTARCEALLEGFACLNTPSTLAASLALSLGVWGTSVLACFASAAAFWPDVGLPAAAFALTTAVFGITVMAVPAGIGVMQASMVFGLSAFDVPYENALVAAIAYHGLVVALNLALGCFSLQRMGLTLGGLKSALADNGSQADASHANPTRDR